MFDVAGICVRHTSFCCTFLGLLYSYSLTAGGGRDALVVRQPLALTLLQSVVFTKSCENVWQA